MPVESSRPPVLLSLPPQFACCRVFDYNFRSGTFVKVVTIAALLCIIITTAVACRNDGSACLEDKEEPRFRVEKNNMAGYIDRNGKLVIPLQYNVAFEFSEGLAVVEIKEKYGIIDCHGNWIKRPGTDQPGAYSYGLSSVMVGGESPYINGKWGYLGRNGKIAIKPLYEWTNDFSDGLASVNVGANWVSKTLMGGKWGFLDTKGNMVIPAQYDTVTNFSERLAAVKNGKHWWYINKQGVLVIKSAYTEAGIFSGGLAPARIDGYMGGKWGYINTAGAWVIQPAFDYANPFFEGIAQVSIQGKFGYIDRTGKIIVEPQYENASEFSEGLAPVLVGEMGSGVWGYIDISGKLVIQPRFTWAYPFHNGLAAVNVDWKTGYIDHSGKFIWQPTN
jgi:WG containing repeat